MKLIAAMSGGVDSAVAAARVKEAGHDVIGVHLALAKNPQKYRSGARGCCTVEDSHDARRAADLIGIPFYIWDMSDEFHEEVVEDFLSEYSQGRTPNPCLRCNEKIKFAAVLNRARAMGFDGVATGHYAIMKESEIAGEKFRAMYRGIDPSKDQSYVLAVLNQQQLDGAYFPLGDTSKEDIRKEAAARGLLVANKPDSHDICFVPSGDNASWLRDRLGSESGPIIDEQGNHLGKHQGAYTYTVGQRRGLNITIPREDGQPRYVLKIEPKTNTLIVGQREGLAIQNIEGERTIWCGPVPSQKSRGFVQVRAHGTAYPCSYQLVQMKNSNHNQSNNLESSLENISKGPGESELVLLIESDQVIMGLAPGQGAVVYDGERVVGSATVRRAW